jgi:peptidoglycan hydrolase-like protein with peptidoglycan-binding domain
MTLSRKLGLAALAALPAVGVLAVASPASAQGFDDDIDWNDEAHPGYSTNAVGLAQFGSSLAGGTSCITTVDGVYGPATTAAVACFQNAVGIWTDGIMGPVTWGKMRERISFSHTVNGVEFYRITNAWPQEVFFARGYGTWKWRKGEVCNANGTQYGWVNTERSYKDFYLC